MVDVDSSGIKKANKKRRNAYHDLSLDMYTSDNPSKPETLLKKPIKSNLHLIIWLELDLTFWVPHNSVGVCLLR